MLPPSNLGSRSNNFVRQAQARRRQLPDQRVAQVSIHTIFRGGHSHVSQKRRDMGHPAEINIGSISDSPQDAVPPSVK